METTRATGSPEVARARVAGYGLIISLSVIWGLAFVAIKVATSELTPVNLTILRWLIASAGFLVVAPFVGRPKQSIRRQHIPRILIVSLASVVGYHLSLNYAEIIVSSGLAGLLISMGPIFAVLLSALFLKEKIGPRLMLALTAASTGAIVLSVNSEVSFEEVSGPAAVVFAAFMYAVFSVASKPLVKEYGALPTAIWVAVIGTAFALPLVSADLISQTMALSLIGWVAVIYLAIVSTVLANMILYTLISGREVGRLSVQLYLVPLVSLAGGILLLDETFTALTVVGTGFLFTGVALATSKG